MHNDSLTENAERSVAIQPFSATEDVIENQRVRENKEIEEIAQASPARAKVASPVAPSARAQLKELLNQYTNNFVAVCQVSASSAQHA